MVIFGLSYLLYQYGSNIQEAFDNIEISNTAKKVMINGKISQEQMLLKGETNLFTNLIGDNVSSLENKILNRIDYELKYNSDFYNEKSGIVSTSNLCSKLIIVSPDINLNDCITVLNTQYNFNTINASGIKINIDNIGKDISNQSKYESAIDFLNNTRNLSYTKDDNAKIAKLSSNTLHQFESSIKDIENITADNTNYISNDSLRFTNTTNQDVTISNKNKFLNIVNGSFTNKNSLITNIDSSSESDLNIKESIKNKDVNGNIKDLISNYNNNNFANKNTISNLDVVNAFEENKDDNRESFSFYR